MFWCNGKTLTRGYLLMEILSAIRKLEEPLSFWQPNASLILRLHRETSPLWITVKTLDKSFKARRTADLALFSTILLFHHQAFHTAPFCSLLKKVCYHIYWDAQQFTSVSNFLHLFGDYLLNTAGETNEKGLCGVGKWVSYFHLWV